jgi:DNA helicase-2/ATP-dependent DNA helicase PcrA
VRNFTPTPDQERLINLVEGSYLVQAPPGTGKTEVLTQRVISLLEKHPGETFRILGLTFTTKAAENLRERVKTAVGQGVSERVTACTFHAFCLQTLQDYGHFVNFAADTTVYESEDDRLDVLSRALDEEGVVIEDAKELRQRLVQIGVAKRDLIDPELRKDDDPDLAVAYSAYNRVLRRYRACDFDDLLWLTWKLFSEAPKVAKHYRRLYRFIMIDEAQDTSRAQYEILRSLCGEDHRNVMMVADSDQFIYRFTGASPKWLEAFVKDFDAERHQLAENFRCAAVIVEAAKELASRSSRGVPKMVVAGGRPPQGVLTARSYRDEPAEAVGVVTWVQQLLEQGLDPTTLHPSEMSTVRPEEICVLARNRYALTGALEGLERRGIEVLFRAGRKGLVETAEAELVLHSLRLLQNPSDAVTRESILARWRPSIATDLTHVPVDEFFRAVAAFSPGSICDVIANAGQAFDLTELVRSLLEALRELETSSGRDNEDWAFLLAGDLDNLEKRWREYSGHVAPEARSLGGLLGELALAGQSVIEGPGVRVLTVHAAKGLEFKAVALLGMNEGTLPDYRSRHRPSDVADERRIAYVAVTRASRALFLTRPRVRQMPWGDLQVQQESRFISEMGLAMEDT